jgi:hypothetical protein
MRNKGISKSIVLSFILSFVLAGAAGVVRAEDEREDLIKQQHALQARVVALKKEQDFLQFQKRMYETDSKYLVINSKKKTAQLRYKNRLLKEIRFKSSPDFPGKKIRPGQAALTRKIEGKKERHALVFGNAFVVRWKRSEVTRPDSSLPFIMMLKKDLMSFYYTVEPGMPAYVSP